MPDKNEIYRAIAQNLREFGYTGVSANMIEEIHEAMMQNAELPHGVVGMFARDQLQQAQERDLL